MTGRPSARQGAGRRVLYVVALILLASAVARFGSGTGAAIARELAPDEAVPRAAATEEDIAPDLVALLKQVRAREAAVAEREAEIEARMQVLALVESEVKKDIQRLEAAEAGLRATISVANQAAETDIARLTAVYENMKPDQASALFQRMDPSFAAGFLGRMRPDAAAAIMAGLDAELAYSISVVLAGRNADVPVEPIEK